MNSRLNCYRWVQNLLPSSSLPKNIKIEIRRILVLPVVLCGCKHCHIERGTWAEGFIFHWYIFRSERLKIFESRVPRNVFGPEREGETGGCRQLHSNELHDLHSSLHQGNQIKENEMGDSCGTTGEKSVQGFGGETWWKETTWKT